MWNLWAKQKHGGGWTRCTQLEVIGVYLVSLYILPPTSTPPPIFTDNTDTTDRSFMRKFNFAKFEKCHRINCVLPFCTIVKLIYKCSLMVGKLVDIVGQKVCRLHWLLDSTKATNTKTHKQEMSDKLEKQSTKSTPKLTLLAISVNGMENNCLT